MGRVAIVNARGGSRRLPRKNILPFCGLPLLAWTIIQARTSKSIDEVIVSTDDDEIEYIALKFGAEVIRRPDWPNPDEIAGSVPTLHALDTLEEQGRLPEETICLTATSPLRLPGDLDRMVSLFYEVGSLPVTFACPNRETMVLEKLAGGACHLVLFDKSHAYLSFAGGMGSIQGTSYHRRIYKLIDEIAGTTDAGFDKMTAGGNAGLPRLDPYYVECTPWQLTEVDTAAEFELAEVLMQHYILKGRPWQEVYDG